MEILGQGDAHHLISAVTCQFETIVLHCDNSQCHQHTVAHKRLTKSNNAAPRKPAVLCSRHCRTTRHLTVRFWPTYENGVKVYSPPMPEPHPHLFSEFVQNQKIDKFPGRQYLNQHLAERNLADPAVDSCWVSHPHIHTHGIAQSPRNKKTAG